MKPSERIDMVTEKLMENHGMSNVAATFTAIITYMDEEWESRKGIGCTVDKPTGGDAE